MRLGACATLLALAALAPASASSPAAAKPAPVLACDLRLDVDDPDPRGINVRATPAGRVLRALPLADEWTEVHVTGQSGDWFRIDLAETVDDEAPEGMRVVFRGEGWVHRTGLGVSELETGEGTVLRAGPAEGSALLRRITSANEPKHLRILGCRGQWLQIDADGLKAWTKSWCNNQRTTCS